ncbi:uncharacterized protein LOC135349619 [Halichondria panicea]|uniref:uncharacterized protein LOC135349619 n=1 Tax=Halichondria panicea TaxID=6063 RepID=UPI00312B7F8E
MGVYVAVAPHPLPLLIIVIKERTFAVQQQGFFSSSAINQQQGFCSSGNHSTSSSRRPTHPDPGCIMPCCRCTKGSCQSCVCAQRGTPCTNCHPGSRCTNQPTPATALTTTSVVPATMALRVKRCAVPSVIVPPPKRRCATVPVLVPVPVTATTVPANTVPVTVPATTVPSKSKKVHVGGLPAGSTKEDINQALRQFGPISCVVIPAGGSGPRGFAFATFENLKSYEEAIKRNFVLIKGKNVSIRKIKK